MTVSSLENTLCLSEARSPFAFLECGYEQTTHGAHRIGSGMISVFLCEVRHPVLTNPAAMPLMLAAIA